MRIVTWNMNYRGHSRSHDAAWRWLTHELRPDVALLQECRPPDWATSQGDVRFARAYSGSRAPRWGTALVTTLPASDAGLPEADAWLAEIRRPDVVCSATRLEGWSAIADIALPWGTTSTFVSLHNPYYGIDARLLQGRNVDDIRLTVSKHVWLLDVVSHFLRARVRQGASVVLGGDFNSSVVFDSPKPRGNAEIFERLTAAGLVSLHRLHHPADEQTYFNPRCRPVQLDYLYADATISSRVGACFVVPYTETRDFSDHAPIVADLA